MRMMIRLEVSGWKQKYGWARYGWNKQQQRWNNVAWKGQSSFYADNPIIPLRLTFHAPKP